MPSGSIPASTLLSRMPVTMYAIIKKLLPAMEATKTSTVSLERLTNGGFTSFWIWFRDTPQRSIPGSKKVADRSAMPTLTVMSGLIMPGP